MAQHPIRPLVLLLALALALHSPAFAADASDEIVIPARKAGFKPWATQVYEYHRANMGAVFAQKYKHGQPWADEAEAVLDAWARSFADLPGCHSTESTREGPQRLIDRGCDDPMIAFCQGLNLFNQRNFADALEMFRASYRGFQKLPYPPWRVACAALRVAVCLDRLHRGERSPEWLEMIAASSAANLRVLGDEQSRDPVAKQLYQEWLGEVVGDDSLGSDILRPALIAELERTPSTIDPWLLHMLRGQCEVALAWKDRGSGWASSVTEAGWKGFAEHLAAAEREYQTAWTTDPTLPAAAAEQIVVAMGRSSGETAECAWFNRAIAVQMDFAPAYRHLSFAWTPRWGGSREAMLGIGVKALATGAFDIDLPNLYLGAVFDVAADLRKSGMSEDDFWESPELWPNLERVCEGYLAEPSRAAIRSWDLSRYAGLAYRCGRRRRFKELVRQLDDQINLAVFKSMAGIPLATALPFATDPRSGLLGGGQ